MKWCRELRWSPRVLSIPGDLPNPGIKLASLTSSALAGGFFTTRTTWEAQKQSIDVHYIQIDAVGESKHILTNFLPAPSVYL